MAARNTTITLAPNTHTQLTDNDVTSITFQNKCDNDVHITVTASASAPSDLTSALVYPPSMGEANKALSDLAPGITGARVYAYAKNGGEVLVSHAS